MTPERHARVKELFLAAAQIPQAQREEWLRLQCQDDDLRGEVETLLARHTDATIVRATLSTEAFGRSQKAGTTATTVRRGSADAADAGDGEERPAGTLVAGRYRIVSKLGRGGMGVVYRADDTVLCQPVAIKFLPPEIASSPIAIARFRNEARLARTVTHPNVCRIHDINEAEGEHFITMEFVAGEDLASLLRRIGRLPLEKGVDVTRQTCAGLAAAHSVGVLHRDLKPANILIDNRGNVRISDFGLAAVSRELSRRERLAGTPAYMAPEQIRGTELSARTDVYALGLVMYEMFSGHPVVTGSSVAECLDFQLTEQPDRLSAHVADIPAEIDSVVDRCLRKEPAERPPSALHVAAALPGTDLKWLSSEAFQTPDPDLLAAAAVPAGSVQSQLRLAVLSSALLVALVAVRMMVPTPWDRPSEQAPQVLADHSRRLLQEGGIAPLAHAVWGYCTAEDAWRAILRTFALEDAPIPLLPQDPAEPSFFYRESHHSLVPTSAEHLVWGSSLPQADDPPPDRVASSFVLLDGQGRLRILWSASSGSGPGDSPSIDGWQPLLRAAGLGPDVKLTAEEVAGHEPFLGCTTWRRTEASDARDSTVFVGCAAPDHPTLFAVGVSPATAGAGSFGLSEDAIRRGRVVTLSFRTLFLALAVVCIPLVAAAVPGGRLDLQGAVRLGALVALASCAAAILRLGWVTSYSEAISMFSVHMVRATGLAALLGLFYLGVDRYARRFWPRLQVTWNHLWFRGVLDPVVRRHVLIGVCLGCWFTLLKAGESAFVHLVGWPARPQILVDRFAEKLVGSGAMIASLLMKIPLAITAGLMILVMLVALRAVFRKSIPAAVLAVLILLPIVVPRGANPYSSLIALGIGFSVVCIWVAIRFGMLAVIVGFFVAAILITSPVVLDPQSWLFPMAALRLGLVALLIVYGAWPILATQPRQSSGMAAGA